MPRRSTSPSFRPSSSQAAVLAVIALGGAVGSLMRYGLSEAFPHADQAFAWGTFLANVSGAFAIGVLMVYVIDVLPPTRYVRPFLGVGVLGGFTTFSTYMLDTRGMLASGQPATAAAYLFGSLVAGLIAVWLGMALTQLGLAAVVRVRRPPPGDLPMDPDSPVSGPGTNR